MSEPRTDMLLRILIVLLWGQTMAQTYIRKDVYVEKAKGVMWSVAQRHCRDSGYVDLSTYKNDQEYELLPKEVGSQRVWIGLHQVDEIWKWIDGENLTSFQKWGNGEPIGNGQEKCASMYLGEWFDRPCDHGRRFLCFYWSHKLILVRERKTWEEALMHCRSHHTDLASLPLRSDLWQASNLSSSTQTPNVWTSLRFLAGDWLWVGMNATEGGEYEGTELPQCPLQPLHCGALSWEAKALTNRDCLEELNFICYEKI